MNSDSSESSSDYNYKRSKKIKDLKETNLIQKGQIEVYNRVH